MSLGKRVRERRTQKGMTQQRLADEVKMAQATIWRIEAGIIKQLKSEALKRLAQVLGVRTDYLVGSVDKPTADDVIDSDSTAGRVFRDFDTLTKAEQEEVENFVRFVLERRQDKENQ